MKFISGVHEMGIYQGIQRRGTGRGFPRVRLTGLRYQKGKEYCNHCNVHREKRNDKISGPVSAAGYPRPVRKENKNEVLTVTRPNVGPRCEADGLAAVSICILLPSATRRLRLGLLTPPNTRSRKRTEREAGRGRKAGQLGKANAPFVLLYIDAPETLETAPFGQAPAPVRVTESIDVPRDREISEVHSFCVLYCS